MNTQRTMCRKNGWWIAALCVLAVLGTISPSRAQFAQYTVTDLGPLRGKELSEAYALNDVGQVVGMCTNPDSYYEDWAGTLWQDISPIRLEALFAPGHSY